MKIFLGFLLAMLSCTSCAATNERAVDISPLSTVYEREQPVRLVLKNVGQKGVRVYSNLEVVDERGEWITWPFRAEDGRSDVISVIYPLGPGASTDIAFDVRKIVLPPIPAGHKPKIAEQLTFRFRVVVLRANSDDMEDELFSESFVVRHPYGRSNP